MCVNASCAQHMILKLHVYTVHKYTKSSINKLDDKLIHMPGV